MDVAACSSEPSLSEAESCRPSGFSSNPPEESNWVLECTIYIMLAGLTTVIVWYGPVCLLVCLSGMIFVILYYEFIRLSWQFMHSSTLILVSCYPELQTAVTMPPSVFSTMFPNLYRTGDKCYTLCICAVGLLHAGLAVPMILLIQVILPGLFGPEYDHLHLEVVITFVGFACGVATCFVPSSIDVFLILLQTFVFYAVGFSITSAHYDPIYFLAIDFVACATIRICTKFSSFIPNVELNSDAATNALPACILCIRLMLDAVGIVYVVGLFGLLSCYTFTEKESVGRRELIDLLFVVWCGNAGNYVTKKLASPSHPILPQVAPTLGWKNVAGSMLFAVVGIFIQPIIHQTRDETFARVMFALVGGMTCLLGDIFIGLLQIPVVASGASTPKPLLTSYVASILITSVVFFHFPIFTTIYENKLTH